MFTSSSSRQARKARHHRLHSTQSSGFRASSRCPRRRLTLQAFFLLGLILLTPLFSAEGRFAQAAVSSSSQAAVDLLAIDSPDFTLDVLAVTADGFLIKNAGQTGTVDRSNLADITEYIVESGDSLSGIARRFGVSMDTIVWENGLTNPHNLKVGSTLRILPVSGITHATQGKDTIASVAKKYGLTTEQLVRQNQLEVDADLIAGTKLVIPGGRRTISTNNSRLIASTGTYAAYKSPVPMDGTIIVANRATDKIGKWMVRPTIGKYTTYFGSRRGHWAVDIADRSAPSIVAAANGTVVKSQCGWNGGYGCVVVIDHGDGVQTLYAHLRQLDVSVGAKVTQSQQIGLMGATGRVWGKTGIHLHFEVVDNGRKKNPLAYY